MNELVFTNNDQVVTSSRNVARDFEKEHYNVLRDIEGVLKNEGAGNLFHKTTYIHEQNKQEYPMYLMNREGFTLLVMGFTGRRAMQFKMQYINAFNHMEKELIKPKNNLEVLQMTVNELTAQDKRITSLEETMRIDGAQEYRIRQTANRVVLKSLGGKNAPAYKVIARKVFSAFWRDFKDHFVLPRYGDLPKVQFDEAINFINVWQPDTSTRLEIQNINKQQTMKGVV